MGKLHKKLSKYSLGSNLERSVLDKETFDVTHPLSSQVDNAYDARVAAEKALKEAENQKVIPLPDEEELARVRRRENAKRRNSGRSSTVYTDGDSLGG